MTYSIKHINGRLLFESATATDFKNAIEEALKHRADLSDANLHNADLRGADFWGADLGGADLRNAHLAGANLYSANLRSADLSGADLRSADLGGADLRNAHLAGADLYSANLRSADLSGADLRGADFWGADLGEQWIIQGQTRSDGYAFFLQHLKDETEPMVKAGCRYFTVPDAFAHWKETHGDTPLGRETMIIINSMIEIMNIRGLK